MAVHASYAPRISNNSGFALLELAVVVTILGLITAIALPAYAKIQRNTRFGALINDYRVFASAFHQYSAVNAGWPAHSTAQGEFPQGMEEYLRTTNWHQPTVFGGHYNWDRDVTHNGRKVRAAIAIYSEDGSPLTMTPAEMQLFDARYDDGDLATGYFQKGFQDSPLYIIEDDPLYAASTPAPPAQEATGDDIENLPSAEEEAAEKAAKEKADQEVAEKAAQEKAEKEAAEKAANEAAEKAVVEKAAKEAAEKAAAEEAAKQAEEKAGKEKAEKEAAEKAAKEAAEKAAAEKAAQQAAEKAAQEKAAKEAEEKAAKEKADQEAAEKAAAEAAAKNTPVGKATSAYDALSQRAAQAGVKVPQSLTNSLNKLKSAADTLAATDPGNSTRMAQNTKAYETAQKNAQKALDSFEKTVAKAETKK